jgi:DNA-directed RNA polymerase specialized sigma24 family protein
VVSVRCEWVYCSEDEIPLCRSSADALPHKLGDYFLNVYRLGFEAREIARRMTCPPFLVQG